MPFATSLKMSTEDVSCAYGQYLLQQNLFECQKLLRKELWVSQRENYFIETQKSVHKLQMSLRNLESTPVICGLFE